MYPNLNAECARRGIKKKDLAKNVLNISPNTLSRKLRKRRGFYFVEALAIKKFLNSDVDLTVLFEFDDSDEIKEGED